MWSVLIETIRQFIFGLKLLVKKEIGGKSFIFIIFELKSGFVWG